MSISTPCFVGQVAVSGPNAKGYYRLKWLEPNGLEGDTSGSRELDYALEKAALINARLQQAAGPKATTYLADIVREFIADGRSPYKDKKHYKADHLDTLRDQLETCLRVRQGLRAMDVDRSVCDDLRRQAGTHNGVVANTTALRALLRWGYQHDYFTPEQAELLPPGGAMPEPLLRRVCTRIDEGGAVSRARTNGATEAYVTDEDCPSVAQVPRLAAALQEKYQLWGELACELAANSGPRWGEQFQLTAFDVHFDGCARFRFAHAHVDWQVSDQEGDHGRRVLPKGDKRRVIPLPTESVTGYPLREALRARVAAAVAEQRAGTNPDALLFPALRGGMLWHTSFNGHLLDAMVEVGLPVEVWRVEEQMWDDQRGRYVTRTRTERRAVFTWHSLRHRFARVCVDVKGMREGELMSIGGWENIGTVQNRYYRSGDDNMNAGLSYFD